MTTPSKRPSTATYQSGTKFSGLSDYPSALSEVPQGALQQADNVVIDRPGIVSPRRGQRVYSQYITNLLTANQATGGDALVSTAGFFAGLTSTYNSPAADTMLALIGPDATEAWQRLYSVRATYLVSAPTGGLCLLSTLPDASGTYTFSVYVAFIGASSFNATLTVIDSSGTSLLTSSTPVNGNFFKWVRLTGTFTAVGNAAIQIAVSQDGTADNEVFADGLQLQPGSTASVWTPPGGLVCTRLFQVNKSVYGFFTADGLPTSPGSFFRVVDTADGDTQPTCASAPWSETPNYFFPPPANAVHELQTKTVQYYSTGDGIMKLLADLDGATSGTIVPAGMPFGLDTQVTLNAAPAGSLGFLQGGYATAYRVVWGNTDPQGNLTLGAPSPAVTLLNPKQTTQGLLYFPTNGTDFASFIPTAFRFKVTLPYTANTNDTYNVSITQGGTVRQGILIVANGSAVAAVILRDSARYFGPVGTAVSVTINATILSVTASPQTLTFTAGVVQSTGWAGTVTVYQPFNALTAADTSGAANVSSVVTAPTNATVTAITGTTFTPGPVGIIQACTVQTAQLNQIYVYETAVGVTVQPVQVGDNLTLSGVTGQSTVLAVALSVGTHSGQNIDAVTLTAFPEGLLIPGTDLFDIYRPSNTSVSFVVPQEAYLYTAASTGQNTTAFYQVYRSYIQTQIIPGTPPQCTDVMQQCYQGELTGTSGATTISFTDIAPDATLGAEIYTSPQQPNGGILGALFQPPVASDMTLYQGSALYANAFLPATFSSELLAVSSTNMAGLAALQPGDVVRVNGTDFTATNSGSPTAQQFTISTGSGSITTDNTNTVINLSRQVNKFYVASTDTATALPIVGENVTLLSTSTPTDLGGNMSWRTARGVGKFTLEFIDNPTFPHNSPFVNLVSDVVSTVLPTEQQNAVYYSPQDQPEGVPLLNSIVVGAANYEVQRILPLPGSCLIFKPEGVFQLAGTTPAQYSVQALNSKAQLLSNESAVILQGSVIAFTTQGVTTITPAGVQILSLPINDTLLATSQLPAFAATAFGVAHETERRYMLWVPSTEGDMLPTQAYTYNLITSAWSRWPLARVCGLVSLNGQLLYSGSALPGAVSGEPSVYREANLAGDQRYGDEIASGTFTVTGTRSGTLTGLTAPAGTNVPVSFGPGSALVLASGIAYPNGITTINATSVGLTFATDLTVTGGAATLVQAVTCIFAPVPVTGDDVGEVKQFQEFTLNYVNGTCPNVSATTATDFATDATLLPLAAIGRQAAPLSGWGAGAWGSFPWGSGPAVSAAQTVSARQLAPVGASRGHSFWPTVTALVAANYFGAQALTLNWTLTHSTRQR